MTRINCHSAFKHYEMFHSGCHGGGNYGSIFNTTYNIDCGGHGGFWGGFGAGLGNAFGNLFGGWFGGGMNMGFGGFGNFGGFGLGGFGFPSFGGGWGNFWGGGNAGGSTRTGECTCGCKDSSSTTKTKDGVNDKDNAIYEGFEDSIAKLKADDEAGAKDLYNKIKAKYENPEDPVYSRMNKGAYHDLLNKLKAKYPNTEFEAGSTSTPASTPTSTTPTTVTPAPQPTEVTTPVTTPTTESKAEEIAAAGNFDDLPDYNKLSDDDKKKYLDKCINLAKDATPEDLREALAKLPAEVRAKVKASFYKPGYKNVEAKDITAESLKNLIEVIDDSPIADFRNITIGTPTKSGDNLWTIPMTSQSGSTKVDYIQVSVDPVDGELIFHGRQTNQHYVLQKDENGKLHLMQYKYHEGYGTADVKS